LNFIPTEMVARIFASRFFRSSTSVNFCRWRHPLKTFRFLTLLFLFVSPLHAQSAGDASTPDEPEVALDALIERALKHNPQLPVARETAEAARHRVDAARALGNPVLQITHGFTGSDEARDEEIVLSQPLDLFGKRRARGNVARAELRAAQFASSWAERSLVVAVKGVAAELFAAQESEKLERAQVGIAQQFHSAAKRRAELGDVPPVQVQRADLELLRAQNELTKAEAERRERRAALNQLVGQDPATPLRVALPTLATSVSKPDAAALHDKASKRSDIAGAEATLAAQRAQVQVLRRERWPEVELQARRSSVFGNGSTALRAVITVPIFDFGSNKNERRALESEARAQQAQIALQKSQASTQVEQALIRLEQQHAIAERYRTGIVPQTLDLLRKTQIGYAQGASSYLEVLDAQRTLRQVQTEYLQALAGARIAEMQLESAVGSPLLAPTSTTTGGDAE
jgi:cobalt-zinc-cadmium efflux system outer membrane protein